MAKSIYVQHLSWDSTEDDYEQGEQPGTTVGILDEKDVGLYSSFEAMKNDLHNRFGITTDSEAWGVFDDEDRPARIDVQFLVDENNVLAEPSDIAEWKRGRKKLWNAYVTIHVLIGDMRLPTVHELVVATGLPIV